MPSLPPLSNGAANLFERFSDASWLVGCLVNRSLDVSNAAAKKLGLGKFIPSVGRLFCAPVSVALILCAALAEALPAALSQCVPPPSVAATLKAQPDASAYARLGNWFANRNQPACAADAFDKAVAMQPGSADYAYHLGISLFSAGEPGQAITPLEQSLRIDSTSVDAHLVLGSVLSRVGRRADADAQWRIVLSLDAKSSAALEYLSRDLLVDGNYVAVIDLLRPVEISGKLSATSAVNLSVAYTKAGLLSNAYDVLQTALRTNPSSVQVIEALSAVLVMLDRYQDASQILAVVARQYPGDVALQIRFLRLLVLTHDPAAEPLCKRLLKADPNHWELLYLMGLLQQNAQDFTAARTWFENSVTRNPDYADSHFHLGLVLATLNDNSAAKEHLEKAIALGSTNRKFITYLARRTTYSAMMPKRSNNFSSISKASRPN